MDLYIEVDASINYVAATAEAHESFDYASVSIEQLVEDFLGEYSGEEGTRSSPLSQDEINELALAASKLREGAEAISKFIRENQAL